ncbi:hypothetical protein DNU06_08900 [Putridiphycobacter roseus]|uniref:PKD domain-containing protein n=1 Tax=Putridiphycobacter roseus TaxID=2219161 RepID=A0A2W1MYV1_9FLAO|nr:PKD domain-containing protein [Putridiphycobacter roseus]PZE17379.1 hypothetical protein DNU06_08900 [Putridiphycobacter roseus]
MKSKFFSVFSYFTWIVITLSFNGYGQNFLNGDLNGNVSISSTPTSWIPVPFTDPASLATAAVYTNPDVCGPSGPNIGTGIYGSPFSGNTFASGMYAISSGIFIYHEGIQQTVNGFSLTSTYKLTFHQTIVKQSNCLDTSGAWRVYMDNTLLGTSNISINQNPYDTSVLTWDFQQFNFTPTAASHTFKFLPYDDDADLDFSTTNTAGALRLGIDSITIQPVIDCLDSLNLGPDTTICFNDTLHLVVSDFVNFNYLWSNNDTDSITDITTPGMYTLEIDSTYCHYYDTINVSFTAPIVLDLGTDTTLCFGDSILLDATTPNASYLWSTSSTDSAIYANQTNTYIVNVTQNNCNFYDTISINYHPILPLNLGPDTLFCAGDSIQLGTHISATDYLWSNGSNDSSATFFNSGNVWVDITENNCVYTDTIAIGYHPILNLDLGNDTTICIGDSLLFDITTPNASYLWNDLSTLATNGIYTAGILGVTLTQFGCTYTDSITVGNFTPPTFDLGNDTTLCYGDSILLDATTLNATYLWSDASTTPSIQATQATIYSVTLTQNNCDYFDTIHISYFTTYPNFLGNDTLFCAGDSIQLGAQLSASSYLWSNGSTDSSTTFFNPGIIWVEVMQNNCLYTDTISIGNHPILNLDLGNDTTICIGDSLLFDITTPNASYLWNDLSTLATNGIYTAGILGVTLTQFGCTYTDSIIVSNFTPPTFDLGNDTTICYGDSILLDVTTLNATYLWSNGANTATLYANQATNYDVVLTKDNCTYYDSIIVNINAAINPYLGNDTTLCAGDSLKFQFNYLNALYIWSDLSTNTSLTVYNSGDYTVEINSNNCIYKDTISVIFNPAPSLHLGNDTSFCTGSSIPLDAGAGFSYLWQDNSINQIQTVNTAGTYWVVIENGNGCKQSDTIEINQIDISVTLGPDLSLCEDDVAYIQAIGTDISQYEWQDNSTNASYTTNMEGTYFVEVTNAACSASDTIEIKYTQIQVDFTGETENCTYDNTKFIQSSSTSNNSVINSYSWNFGDNSYSNVPNPKHQYKQANSYDVSLTVTTDNYCSDTVKKINFVTIHPTPNADFTFSPNPVSDLNPVIYLNDISTPAPDFWRWEHNHTIFSDQKNNTLKLNQFDSGNHPITLYVYTKFGCGDTIQKTVLVKETEFLYIPNAFTPEGNKGINNDFSPVFTDGFDPVNYHFIIFNKWGEILFESYDPNVGWDGYYNGKLCKLGAYIWQMNYQNDLNAAEQIKTGHVSLIR